MNSKSDHIKNVLVPTFENGLTLQDDNETPLEKQLLSMKLASNNKSVSSESLGTKLEQIPPKLLQKRRPLAPFIAKRFEVEGEAEGGIIDGFKHDMIAYDEKSNLIICCPNGRTVYFYDATTLKQSRSPLKFKGFVTSLAFSSEVDTLILGYSDFEFYAYKISENKLDKWDRLNPEPFGRTIVLGNSSWVAFSTYQLQGFLVIDLKGKDDGVYFYPANPGPFDIEICSIESQGIVILSSKDREMSVHRTRTSKFPRLLRLFSRKIYGKQTMKSIIMNKREYLIASDNYPCIIKIYEMKKGKMALLKVIRPKERIIYGMVYLEEYKMIAVAGYDGVEFIEILSGKSHINVDFVEPDWDLDWIIEPSRPSNMFLMKEKNSIGVTFQDNNTIKIIQLY